MPLTVPNTRADAPVVTLFGRMDDGSFKAATMEETSVPYARHWENAHEQVMVYIEPSREQLDKILAALHAGRLDFSSLQNYGSSNGGSSDIPVD